MKAQEKNVINNVNFVKMKNKEQLAKQKAFEFKVDYKPWLEDLPYSDYAEEGYKQGFLAGFSAKEQIIEETLGTLTQLLENMSKLSLTEQFIKSRDFDRLDNKIEVLKSLL